MSGARPAATIPRLSLRRVTLRWIVAAFAVAALVAVATAAAGTRETTTLRVGVFGTLDESSVADQLAFTSLRRSGITVSYVSFATPQATVIAVARGDVDIGITGLQSTTRAIGEGAPVRAILASNMANEWVFVADAPSVAALRGRKVGYQTPGTETQAYASVLLRRYGLTTSDVTMTAVPGSPNRAIALLAGQLAGAWLNYVDFLKVMREKPTLHPLASARTLAPFSAVSVMIVSEDYLVSHRPLLQRVVTGVLSSYDSTYTEAGKARWIALASKAVFRDEPALATRVYQDYRRIKFWPRRSQPVTKAQWESRVLFWLAGDVVDSVPAFEQVWDLSFWRTAARTARR